VGPKLPDVSLMEGSRCDVDLPEQPCRLLTLERLREVEQRPPLTEDRLMEIVGNLCCCLTEVLALRIVSGLCPARVWTGD
jgi:hypothetical protein